LPPAAGPSATASWRAGGQINEYRLLAWLGQGFRHPQGRDAGKTSPVTRTQPLRSSGAFVAATAA